MAEFKEGDLVQLKSGGPKMTVSSIYDEEKVSCKWFAGSKVQNAYFKNNTLILIEEEDGE